MTLRPLFALMLAFAPLAVSAADAERYTAQTQGSLTIDAEGRVVDVELVDANGLGESAIAGVEQLVRSWRFEPIVENGRPVNARGHMRLSLLAESTGDGESTLGVRNAWFVDGPGDGAAEWAGEATSLEPPRYPRRALQQGVGAELMLLVELADDGSVAHVATETVALLGAVPGPSTPALVRGFVEAAERSAAAWRVPAFAGGMVRVPVRFTMWESWARLHAYTWTPDPWVLAKLAEPLAIESLSASGESSRLRLLEAPAEPDATDGG